MPTRKGKTHIPVRRPEHRRCSPAEDGSSSGSEFTLASAAKRQYHINWRFLLVSSGLMLLLAASGLGVHAWQMRRIATGLLDRAHELEAEERWSEAANTWHRFLQLRPDHIAAYEHLASTFDKGASPAQRGRAIDLHFQAIGVSPENLELRNRIAELLLESGRLTSAIEQAQGALQLEPQNPRALGTLARASFAATRNSSRDLDETTLNRLREAVEANPSDVALVVTAAQALREAAIKEPTAGLAEEADLLIDRLVAANVENPLVWLARSQYKVRFALDGAAEDLRQAQELGPANAVVIVAAAEYELQQKNFAEAIRLCQSLPAEQQKAPSVCRLWGDALLGSGDVSAAIAQWRRGLQPPSAIALELQLRLATTGLALNDSVAADEALSYLEDALAQWGSRQGVRLPPMLTEHVNFLRARWHLLRDDWAAAAPLLRRVALAKTAVKTSNERAAMPTHITACLLLAERETQLERWDVAAAMVQSAVAQDPTNVDLRLMAVQACSQAGQWPLALRHAEFALQRDPQSPRARLAIAQLELSTQARLLPADRDFAACDAALDQALALLPNDPRMILLQALRRLLSPLEEGRNQAADLLVDSFEILASNNTYLGRAAVLLEDLGRPAQADQALAQLQKLAPEDAATKFVAVEIALKRRELEQAREMLLALEPQLPLAKWHRAARLWQRLEGAAGQPSAVQQAWERFAAAAPSAPYPRLLLGEFALRSGDHEKLAKVVAELHSIEGEDGATWRYLAARQLLLAPAASPPQKAELKIHSQWLIKQRPGWSRTWVLAGLVAEQEQDIDRAISAYQQVVLLDGSQFPIFERLVALLYRQERYSDVDRLLAVLSSQGSLSAEASLLASGSAAAQRDVDLAIELAEKSLAQDPESVPAALWLAQLQQMQGQFDAAEQTLAKLFERAPDDVRVWGGKLALYRASGDRLKFAQTLEKCSAQTRLPPQHQATLLAQGYEFLGQPMRAAKHYEEAIRQGGDATLNLRLAALQLQYDPVLAEKTLRTILETSPNAEAVRRLLAITLAAQRGDDSWQEIESLLSQSASPGDLRLGAMLHLQSGSEEELKQAQALLEQLLQTEGKALDQDRRMLAWLYEQQGKLTDARSQYDALVREAPSVGQHAHAAAAFCLRQQDPDGALRFLAKWKQQVPIDWTAWHLTATALDMSQREAELAQLLTSLQAKTIERETDGEKRAQARIQFASILTGVQKSEAAEESLRKAVEDSVAAVPTLVAKLLQEQRVDDALGVVLEALRREPSPMLALTLIQVMSTTSAVSPEAEDRLLAFLETTDNAQVLLEASSLRLRQDRRAEATALLERVVEVAPDNVLALNNLAALWADEPAKHADALVMANRALLSAPRPLPFIHDTKAKILLHQGKADEALRELEATVEKWPDAEARIYLHLAFAYEQVGRPSDARAALMTSRARGLIVRELSPADRELLTKLDDRLASYDFAPAEENGAQTP